MSKLKMIFFLLNSRYSNCSLGAFVIKGLFKRNLFVDIWPHLEKSSKGRANF